MADAGADNFLWAWALVDGLAGCGVGHAVLSPGSRSTPLALACERHPRLRTWVQVDERSAAYFALGLAKAGEAPVALVCTSGTAVANWMPAVVEANHGCVPLVLLSADRPAELRECGANQTVDQTKFFGDQVRHFHELDFRDTSQATLDYLRAAAARAVDRALWPLAGPVQLNVPLREPLVPEAMPQPPPPVAGVRLDHPKLVLPEDAVKALAATLSGAPGVIVCGPGRFPPGFAPAVSALAAALAAPVFADPLSGLRCGPHDRSRVLTRYDAFLRRKETAKLRPEWVLRFGDLPVSRALQDYLAALPQARCILADPRPRLSDPLHRTSWLVHGDEAQLCRALAGSRLEPAPSSWAEGFTAQEARAASLVDDARFATAEQRVILAIQRMAPDDTVLFVGNSLVVRDVDTYLAGRATALRMVGNRGASGIDGNVSTALGLAAAGGRVIALLGDLALVHDINGLLAAKGLDATLVVFNNGGGAIFGHLPQSRLEAFERLWLTPTGLDFARAAEAYGVAYKGCEAPGELETVLEAALAAGGPRIVEVKVDREASLAAHRAYWRAVSEG